MTNPSTNTVPDSVTDPVTDPMRNAYLDTLVALGRFIEFYDPDANRHDMPTYPYGWAPPDLATTRQLRAANLRPGGQPVTAQILWRHRAQLRIAFLYRISAAKRKRTATPAQLAAIDKALAARRTCRTCGIERPYFIPRRYGECLTCAGDLP